MRDQEDKKSEQTACISVVMEVDHFRQMWADTILILVISVCTALLGEGVTWVLVYRTEKYQKLKTEIEKQTKKLEKKKEAHGETANLDRSKKRKIEQDEEKLKNTNRDLTMVKMKSMFAIGTFACV